MRLRCPVGWHTMHGPAPNRHRWYEVHCLHRVKMLRKMHVAAVSVTKQEYLEISTAAISPGSTYGTLADRTFLTASMRVLLLCEMGLNLCMDDHNTMEFSQRMYTCPIDRIKSGSHAVHT